MTTRKITRWKIYKTDLEKSNHIQKQQLQEERED